jgi:hypothetical protein
LRPADRYDAQMRHFPLRELGYALGFVVVLTALYFGAYHALVERDGFVFMDGATGRKISGAYVFAKYRFVSTPAFPGEPPDVATRFFTFAHAFDLQVRPTYWDEEVFIETKEQKARESVGLP